MATGTVVLSVNISSKAILYFKSQGRPFLMQVLMMPVRPLAPAITTCLGDGVVWDPHLDNGN